MLTLENDNKLMQLRNSLMKEEMTTQNVANREKSIDTNRVNELIGNYHNNKLNNNINTTNVISNNYIKKEVKRGQIWYVDFGRRQGSLQSGIRPAIIESNDINNKHSNIINVSPLTSNMAKASNIPVHVPIEGFGLKEPSVILIEQGTPIDVRYQLLTYIGTVDELVLQKIKKAREIQLGDLQEKTPLEKLQKNLREEISNRLEAIQDIEKVISRTKTDSLVNKLLNERGDLLYSLQLYCEDNKLNYRDFYIMYKKEEEVKVI